MIQTTRTVNSTVNSMNGQVRQGTMRNNLHEYLRRYSSVPSCAPMVEYSCHKWDRTEADCRQNLSRLFNEYTGAKKGRKKTGYTRKKVKLEECNIRATF